MLISSRDHFRVLHRATRLNDRCRTSSSHGIKTITEREERIRRRDRTLENCRHVCRLPSGRLHGGDLHGIHAAHLAGADCQRAKRVGEDHGVRLHMRHHPPGKSQRLPFFSSGVAFGHHLEAVCRPRHVRFDDVISLLNQQGAEDRAVLVAAECSEVGLQHAQVGLLREDRPGRFIHRRRHHGFNERRDDGRGRVDVDGAVEADDAAEGGQGIRFARANVGFGDSRAGRDTTRIGVLDHRGGRLAELEHDAGGGVEVEQVGEREFLALQNRRRAET